MNHHLKILAFIILLLLVSHQIIFSQTLNYVWEKKLHLAAGYYGVFADKAGNTISVLDSGANGFGYAKYNKSGHLVFAVNSQQGFDLGEFNFGFTDRHNNVILVADAETQTGFIDTTVLIKYDRNGTLLAKNKFLQYDPLTSELYLQDAAIDKNGNIYIAAFTVIDSGRKTTYGTRLISFDSKTLRQRWNILLNQTNKDESHCLSIKNDQVYFGYYYTSVFGNTGYVGVACYSNKDGSLVYDKSTPLNNVSRVTLATDSTGAAYVLAGKRTYIGIGQPDSAVLIKFSTHGKIKWQKSLPDLEYFYWGYPNLLVNNSNQINVFGIEDSAVAIARYDINGNLLHQAKSAYSFRGIILLDATISSAGDIVFLVYGNSSLVQFSEYEEFLDVFDSSSSETYTAAFPDSYSSDPYERVYQKMGYNSVTNNYLFNGFSDDGLPTSAVSADLAPRLQADITSSDETEPLSFSIKLFPNPASTSLNIITSKPLSFFIINEEGKIVQSPFECSLFKSLNISNWKSGEYWLILNDGKNKYQTAIIKQ